MLQLVSLNGRWRDALAVTVIAGFGISGIVGPLELERKHRYININCRTGSLNMLMDWEWFGCDLLNVWCKTETTFPALVGSDVWKMSFIFLRVGVELEGGCSSAGAGRSLFVRLGGLTPGSSCSQVKMFLRNKIHRNCFPNVSCFGSKHLLKWVCCKGWAHPHNKKHIQPNSLFYCYLHLNCRNTFGKYMFLQKTGLCETLLFFSFSFQFSIVTELTWVRNRYIIPYLGSKHPSWSSKYQVFCP